MMNNCCWIARHKTIAETEQRIRDYEVRPLQRQYDMLARTLDATHDELTSLRKHNAAHAPRAEVITAIETMMAKLTPEQWEDKKFTSAAATVWDAAKSTSQPPMRSIPTPTPHELGSELLRQDRRIDEIKAEMGLLRKELFPLLIDHDMTEVDKVEACQTCDGSGVYYNTVAGPGIGEAMPCPDCVEG